MRRICVFCGSNRGTQPVFQEAAVELGKLLAARGIVLVYGGGRVGLMGDLADAVLAAGGEAIGVIPQALLDREVGHQSLTELHVVATMHERKALMADLADAFLALPGGLGTLEEIFEVWTWAQLGMHQKPVGFLNVAGYYAPLMSFLDQAAGAGFVRAAHRAMAIVADDAEHLLTRFAEYQPPTVEKWIRRGEE
ncbi:MAG: LOG family protein [Thermoanaerobaculia bacterium]